MKIPIFAQLEVSTDSVRQALEGIQAEAQGEETISVWQLIQDGGWYIMVPLALLSLIAIYIVIERAMAIRRASKMDNDFMSKIKDYVHEGKLDSAKNLCSTQDTPMARIIEKGIGRIGKPMRDIMVSIENAGKLEIYKLEKGLSTLATIAGAAPMIGFLGTVIGMIITFHTMKISGAGVEIDKLSGGIMQAMVTTVAGLIIGIIAYVAYNTLAARVNKVVHLMEASSIEFLDVLDQPSK